jgi:tyrosyl-tRNA synthetase
LKGTGKKGLSVSDSVKKRMANNDDGLTFTEFSYQLLQGYDFFHLHKTFGVNLQLGGSDQLGNINAGISFIHRRLGKHDLPIHGITTPLLVDSSGEKFGKSVKSNTAIWLDGEKTSPFDFYQYFINRPDQELDVLLKYFTMMEPEDISSVLEEHRDIPHERIAHKILGEHATRLVHGEKGYSNAIIATDLLFKRDCALSPEALIAAFEGTGSYLKTAQWAEIPLIRFLVKQNLVESEVQGLNLIKMNGVSLNKNKITDPSYIIGEKDFLDGRAAVIKIGKSKLFVIQCEKDPVVVTE